jgi:putative tryptophan/tyrosine transport system substrate-binding protein
MPMRRRKFITLLGGAAVVPLLCPPASNAQGLSRLLRVGLVLSFSPRTAVPFVALERRLRELGYVEGQNLAIEFILLNGQVERYGEAMQELVRRKVDVIIAFGPELALKGAIAATDTQPIVMAAIDYDPLVLGYVASLARPGGHITGVFLQQIELAVKRIQLMKDAFPDLQAATMFWDGQSAEQWQATQKVAPTLGLQLSGSELRERPYDYERALAEAPPDHRRILLVANSPAFFNDRQRLADFTLQHRMPSIFAWREWVAAGALMSYGPSFTGVARLVADYVDRIAKGAKPADLPVEQPTKFELVVNLKTAAALGLTIPPTLLARADELIE